jgi:hypothetical protein
MSRVVLDPQVLEKMRAADVMVPTPLAVDSEGTMFEGQQKLLTRYYLEAGASTVVPGTHTGQFARGDIDLYRRWLDLNAEVLDEWGDKSRTFRMAAVGGTVAFDMLRAAADARYDIVMVAPTAFVTAEGRPLSEQDTIKLLEEMAGVAPIYGFYLQEAVGGREFSSEFWSAFFEISYGAKAAPFSRRRTDVMMHAAAGSSRLDELVMVTGNDDYIVGDLLSTWRDPNDKSRLIRMSAGLLGHFASDTHAAVHLVRRVKKYREREPVAGQLWPGEEMVELAGAVTAMNWAVFDTAGLPNSPPFECCVAGIEYRLRKLGILFEETDTRWFERDGTVRVERIRPGLSREIDIAYSSRPELTDDGFVTGEAVGRWKNELGIE